MASTPVRWCVSAVVCVASAWSSVAGPVEDAQQASQRGDYAIAVERFEQAAQAMPELLDDASFMSSWRFAESRAAYALGTTLHKQGEYNAAADAFLRAIAKDSGYELAYAALADAQRAGVQQHLLAALDAADQGDLLTAKRRLEESLVLGGGADQQVAAALASIAEPEKTFDKAVLDQLAEARRLGDDRQWGLAERQLLALVKAEPLMLPARAELTRASRFKSMSEAMTDEAATLIAQQRLSPALEKLASAATVWPYNKRAAELLGSVEAQIKRANAIVEEARQLAAKADWRAANEKVNEALAIDPSLAEARAVRSEVRVGLVKMLADDAQAALAGGDIKRTRELIDRGEVYWPNNRWTRRVFADYQLVLAEKAARAGRTGEAYLRTLLAARDAQVNDKLEAMEQAMLRDADATYAYSIEPNNPSLGVSSAQLADALAGQAYSSPKQVALIRLTHDGEVIAPNAPGDDTANPRYVVRVRITDTDIDLRQRDGVLALNGSGIGTTDTVTVGGGHYWEKYGTVDAAVSVFDQATGQPIDAWTAGRWANYTDRQQYVIGQTWNTSYWTLPTDESIAAQLARDLAARLQPTVEEVVTLARARVLSETAQELDKAQPAEAMDLRVSAVLLAGTVNPREARRELRKMAEQLDQDQPAPTE